MELYAAYIKELNDRECFYNDNCFITYKVYDHNVSIFDYYCKPEYRSKGYMLNLINELFAKFKLENKKLVYGYTDKRNHNWKRSEDLMLKYGFTYIGVNPDDENYNNYVYEL